MPQNPLSSIYQLNSQDANRDLLMQAIAESDLTGRDTAIKFLRLTCPLPELDSISDLMHNVQFRWGDKFLTIGSEDMCFFEFLYKSKTLFYVDNLTDQAIRDMAAFIKTHLE
jgi:hypothetical protein